MPPVTLNNFTIGAGQPLTLIAGPCVVENEKMILETAEAIATAVRDLPVQLIFKASYRKANRTSVSGFTGLPFETALGILEKVRSGLGLPVLTDVHDELSLPVVAEVADVLQIPAFLSRQTDLLLAAGRTGRIVNIKKGQFLAPEDMEKAAEKVASTGNPG
ncbi:MAG TPA: 3-deoxy-8-phosphooctulonate synthase, partial [Calditrichia bacterium]|nr:3-deoxy-8-phosphooctulonate synthase [Calditrichia bacterium]